MPENTPHPSRLNRWQPSGEYHQGAVSFLRALTAADTVALAAWAAAIQPDARWAGWLRDQELAPFAFYQLRQAGAVGWPMAFVGALRGMYYNAVGDAALHTRELAAALDVLAAAGVTAVLFKGAVLAYTVYPDPACRPMGDLDFWVAAEQMPRAQAVLMAAGYQLHAKTDRPSELQILNEGEVQLVGRAGGRGLVELHYSVFPGEWLRRTAVVDRAGLAARLMRVTAAGRPAWTLAPEDALIQLAVHLAVTHQMAAPGLRGLLDVTLLARAHPITWPTVVDRATGWRVATATWLVLRLADALFGLPGADAAIAALRPGLLRRGLLDLFANVKSMLAGRDLTRGPLRLAFQLLLADRGRDAARLLGRALWPEDAWLVARYGRGGLAMHGRHLLSALRGRV